MCCPFSLKHQFAGLLSCIFILTLILVGLGLHFSIVNWFLLFFFWWFWKNQTRKKPAASRTQWLYQLFPLHFLDLTGAWFGKWSIESLSIWNIGKAIRKREEPKFKMPALWIVCYLAIAYENKISKVWTNGKKFPN